MNHTKLKKALSDKGPELFADINTILEKHGLPSAARSISFELPKTVKVPQSVLATSDEALTCAEDEVLGLCMEYDGKKTRYYPCCKKRP